MLALLCQAAELHPALALPPELEVWGIDSGLRCTISGADYGSVRAGAFIGCRSLAELAGLPAAPLTGGRVAVTDARWHGYLANVPPSVWEAEFHARVLEHMDDQSFLDRCRGLTDAVARVDPTRVDAGRQPTAHSLCEHQRVRLFHALLAAAAAPPEASLYGARIAGGGSGRTVAVHARCGAASVQALAAGHARQTGRSAAVPGGSPAGAVQFGAQCLVAHVGANGDGR